VLIQLIVLASNAQAIPVCTIKYRIKDKIISEIGTQRGDGHLINEALMAFPSYTSGTH
jgi:hypothetical protein